jgi:hypothetical protein
MVAVLTPEVGPVLQRVHLVHAHAGELLVPSSRASSRPLGSPIAIATIRSAPGGT